MRSFRYWLHCCFTVSCLFGFASQFAYAAPTIANANCLQFADRQGNDYDPDRALDFCVKAAEEGSTDAELALFEIYVMGVIKGGQDLERAFYWGQKAASHGNPIAQFQIGNFYLDGLAGEVDAGKALLWFTKAAEQGHEMAKLDAETLRKAQNLTPQKASEIYFDAGEKWYNNHPVAAFRWMKRAADAGSALASFYVGRMFMEGYGTSKLPDYALSYLQNAADKNLAEAQAYLGQAYMFGSGIGQDIQKAEKLLRAAADQGDNGAAYLVATLLMTHRDQPDENAKGVAYMQRAADAGVAPAQSFLGQLIVSGAVKGYDPAKGMRYLEDAARQDDEDALIYLGNLNLKSEKPETAAAYFQRAVELGSPQAAAIWGKEKASKAKTVADLAEAKNLLLKSALAGDMEAVTELARVNEKPTVGERNLLEAYKWAIIAAGAFPVDDNNREAQSIKRRLSSSLKDVDKFSAAIAAMTWLRSNFPEKYSDVLKPAELQKSD